MTRLISQILFLLCSYNFNLEKSVCSQLYDCSQKGLISGPCVRTHASKILKREVETEELIDSDTTIIVESVKSPKAGSKTVGKLRDVTKRIKKPVSKFETRHHSGYTPPR